MASIKIVIESIKSEGKDFAKYNINPNGPFTIFSAVGCDECNKTGYNGRIGIFEAIRNNEMIEKIIEQRMKERK